MIVMGSIIVAFFLFVALNSPQTSVGTTARPGPADLVLPLPGSPISVEQLEERTHTLADGTSTVESTTVKVYRDSSGRLRIELPTSVVLIDPVTGSRINLLTVQQI